MSENSKSVISTGGRCKNDVRLPVKPGVSLVTTTGCVYLLHGVDVPHADRVVLSDSGEVASDRVDGHGEYVRRV